MKKVIKNYDVDIINLANKKHRYEFEIDSDMLQSMPDSFLQKGSLKSNVELDKSETMIRATIAISGVVELTCDRSNELFNFDIEIEEKIIFKYGDEYLELTEDIIIIPRTLQKLNLAQYLYEFIVLSLPIKKIHPNLQHQVGIDGQEYQEGILLYTTKDKAVVKEENNSLDPRWEALKKLKK